MWIITKQKDFKAKNPVFIEGLPGIGNVGKVVVDFLIEQLKAKKVMNLFSYSLPNSVFVNEKNLVELPRIEIYHKRMKNNDFLFLTGDVQPADEKASYNFSEKIMEIINQHKCQEIITLGGIGLGDIPKKPKVYCTGNSKEFINNFRKLGAKTQVYGVVGPIIGVSGLLLGLSQQKNIRAAALLAETFGHPMYLGLRGARETLRILEKRYSFNIEMKELDREIRVLEEEIRTGEVMPKIKSIKKLKKYGEMNYIG
jgi:uncharacterized protein (TIGR00162 family)